VYFCNLISMVFLLVRFIRQCFPFLFDAPRMYGNVTNKGSALELAKGITFIYCYHTFYSFIIFFNSVENAFGSINSSIPLRSIRQ
ncbi:MAG: hypothetical protein COA49_08710, partial [Bacteroidetes bacterium]